MANPTDLSETIIEALYCEALVLADEVRATFNQTPRKRGADHDLVHIALSVEGLRTTTRVMQVLAWLLNHRAYCSGDLSDFQLRRQRELPPDRPAHPAHLALLEPATRELIAETEAFHQRIARLDAAWRDRFETRPAAILRLRERLGRAIGAH